MKPGTMTAVGDMLVAAFPLSHELMVTTPNEELQNWRVYCRCGWIAPPALDEIEARARFIDHLLELQDA